MIQPECSVEELRACLKFRKAVAEEFERLLRAGAEGTDLPEVDDGELDPVEQGSRGWRSSEHRSPKMESRS
jgi:hypothetical protein